MHESTVIKKKMQFQFLHNVRQVASTDGAFSALVKDWKYVTAYLESVAAKDGSASAAAKNLLR
jgi:hypothetical protein